MIKSFCLLLVVACACTGCSFSKASRQQRAYSKYVRKSSFTRQKQRSHFFRSNKPSMPTSPMPSEPLQSTEAGPQAMPSDG